MFFKHLPTNLNQKFETLICQKFVEKPDVNKPLAKINASFLEKIVANQTGGSFWKKTFDIFFAKQKKEADKMKLRETRRLENLQNFQRTSKSTKLHLYNPQTLLLQFMTGKQIQIMWTKFK
jgi:hypothetical protein